MVFEDIKSKLYLLNDTLQALTTFINIKNLMPFLNTKKKVIDSELETK